MGWSIVATRAERLHEGRQPRERLFVVGKEISQNSQLTDGGCFLGRPTISSLSRWRTYPGLGSSHIESGWTLLQEDQTASSDDDTCVELMCREFHPRWNEQMQQPIE